MPSSELPKPPKLPAFGQFSISEIAKRFHEKLGFMAFPTNSMTRMITVQAAAYTLAGQF
jgi:hypothetical protein